MISRKRRSRSGTVFSEAQKTAKVVSVRLAPETIVALDAQAEAAGLSRSAYVTRLVAEHASEK